jgi:hypothetical protein
MPTYRNTGKTDVHVSEIGLMIRAGNQLSTILIIPEFLLEGKYSGKIEKLSDLPVYNPILAEHVAYFTSYDAITVSLKMLGTDYIEISNSNINVECWLQTLENSPPLVVHPGDIFNLSVSNNLDTVIIVPKEIPGSLIIREMTNEVMVKRG